jgi:glycosyltransferase involved in cell wall biosynthesis
MTAKLWVDVEDLFEYARNHMRPSGIQRLAFEMCKALRARPDSGETVRFVRHETRNRLRVVPFVELEALFAGLTESEPGAPQQQVIPPYSPLRLFVRKLVHRLPPSLRLHVIKVMLTQLEAIRSWVGLFGALGRGALIQVMRPFRWLTGKQQPRKPIALPNSNRVSPVPDETCIANTQAGDVLLALGSPWSHPDYAALVAAQRARGLRFALLIYDVIPLRRPEWFDRGLVRIFRAWFDAVVPLCDHIFAISEFTAAEVEFHMRKRGIALSCPVTAIPIGTGFGVAAENGLPAERSARLPPPDSYALIVSTIEARKNHILLFRVWRRMLEELPREQVPTLVFAGRVGWLVDDLMQQIANTDSLDGKLVLVENPTDGELRALYEGCRFTLFPSFFEGWGLPVTESLALGKPCLTSNKTSLPEAGGTLTRMFDPDNLNDAYRAIAEVIGDPDGLAEWTNQVRREFKPVPWSDTADAMLCALGHPPVAAQDCVEKFPLRARAG